VPGPESVTATDNSKPPLTVTAKTNVTPPKGKSTISPLVAASQTSVQQDSKKDANLLARNQLFASLEMFES
jgi:hypothetical protein